MIRAANPSTRAPPSRIANHHSCESCPMAGSPMSRRTCRSDSRSKPSVDAPCSAAVLRIKTSAGWDRIALTPSLNVAISDRWSRSPAGRAWRWNPSSGIAIHSAAASSSWPAPATRIGARGSRSRAPHPRRSRPTLPHARTDRRGGRADGRPPPTSSVSHTTSARSRRSRRIPRSAVRQPPSRSCARRRGAGTPHLPRPVR